MQTYEHAPRTCRWRDTKTGSTPPCTCSICIPIDTNRSISGNPSLLMSRHWTRGTRPHCPTRSGTRALIGESMKQEARSSGHDAANGPIRAHDTVVTTGRKRATYTQKAPMMDSRAKKNSTTATLHTTAHHRSQGSVHETSWLWKHMWQLVAHAYEPVASRDWRRQQQRAAHHHLATTSRHESKASRRTSH